MKMAMRTACAVSMIACAGMASASEACWTPQELAAARVRDVQTIMMVGALQCSAQGYNTSFGYDRFVTRHRAELVDANGVLKRHFMRQASMSSGETGYDSFATAMANAHSAESNDMRSYCDRVDSLVRTAVAVRGDELGDFAETISERPIGVGETCSRAMTASIEAPAVREDDQRSRQVAVAVTVAAPPAPVDDAPVETRAPVEVAVLAPQPEPRREAEVVAAPVQVAVLTPPAPERQREAAQPESDAVRQATAALQQATAALQAAIAAQSGVAQVSNVSVTTATPRGPESAGPRRGQLQPKVLSAEPVVAPEVMQFVG